MFKNELMGLKSYCQLVTAGAKVLQFGDAANFFTLFLRLALLFPLSLQLERRKK